MKNRLNIIGLLIAGMSFFSCQENEYWKYDTNETSLNIWLGAQNTPVDSLTYNFAYQAEQDSIVFYVRLTGLPVAERRKFTIEAVEGNINEVDFSFGEYYLEPNQYEASFPIYLNKTANSDQFKDENGYLVFQLKEDSTFSKGREEYSRLYVVLKNGVGKPDNWDNATSPYRALSYYFGTYSDVKYTFIIQTTGKSNFQILYTTSADPELEENVITSGEADYLKTKCKWALEEYNADPDNEDLRDENGELVIFP